MSVKETIPDNDVTVTRSFMGPEWGIYALCYMQVCAHSEVSPEIVERRANEENPSGTSGHWAIAKTGPGEEPMENPVQCKDADGTPTGRVHWMLSC